jgi:hypothetical protein
MRLIPITAILVLYFALFIGEAVSLEQSELLGYTLIAEKTIDGDFEGCDFDKKINFLDGTYLTCATYSYTYSYMPTAYIYARQIEYKGEVYMDVKMVVEDEIYDMYPVRLRKRK